MKPIAISTIQQQHGGTPGWRTMPEAYVGNESD